MSRKVAGRKESPGGLPLPGEARGQSGRAWEISFGKKPLRKQTTIEIVKSTCFFLSVLVMFWVPRKEYYEDPSNFCVQQN